MLYVQLLDLHNCPYKRAASVTAIPELHKALHLLELWARGRGPEFGGRISAGTKKFILANPLPPSNNTPIGCLLPLTPDDEEGAREKISVAVRARRIVNILKRFNVSFGPQPHHETADEFFCGHVVSESECMGAINVIVQSDNYQEKKFIIEDMML